MKSTLLFILLIALTGLTQGSVVLTSIPNPEGFVTQLSSAASPFRRRGLDLNQDGTEDFYFLAKGPLYMISLGMAATNRITGYGYGEGSLDLGGFATSVPPLSIIGAETLTGAEWWNDAYGATIVTGSEIEWGDPRFLFGLHYVGFEFRAGDLTHYGYVKFQGNDASVNILETAWKTEPRKSITIPEPAAGSCLAACAVMAGFRRRRSSGSAVPTRP